MAVLDWLFAYFLALAATTNAFCLSLGSSPMTQRRLGKMPSLRRGPTANAHAEGISGADTVDLHWVEVSMDTGGVGPRIGMDKPPVLLLHGLLGQSRNFAGWAKEFKVRAIIYKYTVLVNSDLFRLPTNCCHLFFDG